MLDGCHIGYGSLEDLLLVHLLPFPLKPKYHLGRRAWERWNIALYCANKALSSFINLLYLYFFAFQYLFQLPWGFLGCFSLHIYITLLFLIFLDLFFNSYHLFNLANSMRQSWFQWVKTGLCWISICQCRNLGVQIWNIIVLIILSRPLCVASSLNIWNVVSYFHQVKGSMRPL